MDAKKIHKTLGLILLLPFLGWISTGIVFLIKPGYKAAYERLSPKLYSLEDNYVVRPQPAWQEVRYGKTVLGNYLVVKIDGEWQHLDPVSLLRRPEPTQDQEIALLSDAIAQNDARYGDIQAKEGNLYITSTGVELALNWNSLTITQKGKDTKLIGLLYKVHYLQWLGYKPANIVLGVLGLATLFWLVYCGTLLYLQRRKSVG